jgi:hypothetical protein
MCRQQIFAPAGGSVEKRSFFKIPRKGQVDGMAAGTSAPDEPNILPAMDAWESCRDHRPYRNACCRQFRTVAQDAVLQAKALKSY